MDKNANLIINRNLYWKLREVIENDSSNWTYGTDYNIVSAYPDLDTVPVYPVFVIMTAYADGLPYELGAKDRLLLQTDIVILANDVSQNDYYNVLLWGTFNNVSLTLYDLSETNPSTVGDYSGIPTLGKYRCSKANYSNSGIVLHMPDNKMNYESTVGFEIEVPQI